MAMAVDEGLQRNGWFVTGRVDSSLFSENFFFSDPQVRFVFTLLHALRRHVLLFQDQRSVAFIACTLAGGTFSLPKASEM